jgi:hypothetical protein
VNTNIAFLELKYGNIYGGYPNFYAISEIALLVFETGSNRIFLESWVNNANVEIVNVYPKVNELGHTIGRAKEVVNLKTRRRKPYKEDFRMEEMELKYAFKQLHPAKMAIRNFLMKNLKKYQFRDIITFDGRRDVFLCERSGVNFSRYNILDLQKVLNKETEYLSRSTSCRWSSILNWTTLTCVPTISNTGFIRSPPVRSSPNQLLSTLLV